MLDADTLVQSLRQAGFGLFTGVPCSYLSPLINAVIDAPGIDYIGAANEGDAVGIACGSMLGGRRGVVMFQNSGLGNAVSPLTSLAPTFQLPVLLITTWRGEPGGPPDEPQHEMMGAVTTRLLELMGIRWELFPCEPSAWEPALARAQEHMEQTRMPFAFVLRHGCVAERGLQTQSGPRSGAALAGLSRPPVNLTPYDQDDVLRVVQAHTGSADLLLATTGYTGRALYALDDRPNQFYMVGSMGCVSSLGLGLARARPGQRVVVVDGDGAALMRLGALATVGHEQPPNLVHILLDNSCHDSTGGQATVSPTVNLANVAASCGYPRVTRIDHLDQLAGLLANAAPGLHFVYVTTVPRHNRRLPRPTMTPAEVAARFQQHLENLDERRQSPVQSWPCNADPESAAVVARP